MKKSRNIWSPATAAVVLAVAACGALAAGVPLPGESSPGFAASDAVLLAVYVAMALVFSFLCSVAEAVLLSVTPSYIAGLREKKPKKAALLKRLKQDDVDRSLAAILTLNTIAHTVGAIGSGAKAAAVFGNQWFGLFSAVMTLAILFLSEIVPKTIGAVFWRKLAGLTAIFVRVLIAVLYPLILVSEKLTKIVAGKENPHVFDRDEFIAMADVGEEAGQVHEHESRIIRNLFRLQSLTAEDIMTPRTVMVALPQDATVTGALKHNEKSPFSRFPLYRKTIDDIVGFVMKDDLLLYEAKNRGDTKLGELKREIATIESKMRLSSLLEYLLDHRRHIALVMDRFGGSKGLVTLEDVVETLLGMEIVDEMDTVQDMRDYARKQWEKRAKALGGAPESPESTEDAGQGTEGASEATGGDDGEGQGA